jgi:hypothetical protein
MPAYKVVLFANIGQTTEVQYLNNQRLELLDAFPTITVDISNSSDTRLLKFAKKGVRCPCAIIFKDGAKVTSKHGKLNNQEAINWVRTIISS